jgi:hypothetical protein
VIVKLDARRALFAGEGKKSGRSFLGAAGEAASAWYTDHRMRECLPGGLMAWEMIIVHIAMANDAAPWTV